MHERPRSRHGPAETDDRSRRRHDDAVLDEVAKAAWEAFPMLPPTRGGPSPSGSGRASRDRDGGAASPAVHGHHATGGDRRRGRATVETTTSSSVEVRPWQLSHVRQYDLVDGYPVQRP